jgi:hypothetical protein
MRSTLQTLTVILATALVGALLTYSVALIFLDL